jgi:hypothetical protein
MQEQLPRHREHRGIYSCAYGAFNNKKILCVLCAYVVNSYCPII